MDAWVQIISTLGFPIVAVMACAYFIFKVWQREQEQSERREKDNLETITRLSAILSENSKALLKNSDVMEKISEKIDAIDNKLENVKEDVQEIKYRQSNNNNNKGE